MFLDVARPENGVYISLILIFMGVVVNTLMLYFIGYLLTRLLMFIRKMMSKETLKWLNYYKSKTGIVLASFYLLVLIWVLAEFIKTILPPSHFSLSTPILFILTLPVSLVFLIISVSLFPHPPSIYDYLIYFSSGGVANALGLYFLGYLINKETLIKKEVHVSKKGFVEKVKAIQIQK